MKIVKLVGAMLLVLILLVSCSNDNKVEYNEGQQAEQTITLKDKTEAILNEVQWEKQGDCLVGEFTNTTEENISYLEIGYKFYDEEGKVIDASWTNEIDIAPGETRVLQIDSYLAEGYTRFEISVNEVNSY